MKSILMVIVTSLSLSCLCSFEQQQPFNIGQKTTTYIDVSRDRPLKTEIWYPTSDSLVRKETNKGGQELFKAIETIPDASIAEGKFPLLLLSHGTGGNRFSLTWFVDKMVKEGYVVVAVDHYGNSTFNKIPREFLKWWERAIDIQYVLTNVLKDEKIGLKVDHSRIGGVGFSLGGYTNIALAGGYVDRNHEGPEENQKELPPEFPGTEEVIDFDNDSLIIASYNQYKDKVKDDRIKAFFVMAPAIGFGFHTEEQTKEITAPIFIVAGRGDTNTPIEYNAKTYHKLIKSSQVYFFDEHVNHYVFLNEATEAGLKILPTLTVDHPNVNRKDIHQETLELAIDFFKNNL